MVDFLLKYAYEKISWPENRKILLSDALKIFSFNDYNNANKCLTKINKLIDEKFWTLSNNAEIRNNLKNENLNNFIDYVNNSILHDLKKIKDSQYSQNKINNYINPNFTKNFPKRNNEFEINENFLKAECTWNLNKNEDVIKNYDKYNMSYQNNKTNVNTWNLNEQFLPGSMIKTKSENIQIQQDVDKMFQNNLKPSFGEDANNYCDINENVFLNIQNNKQDDTMTIEQKMNEIKNQRKLLDDMLNNNQQKNNENENLKDEQKKNDFFF